MNAYEFLKEKLQPIKCNHSHQDSYNKFPHCDLRVNFTKCAILILLYRQDKKFHVLFSIRSLRLKNYSGEICFPGGKLDPNLDKTYEHTALREAHEEIGLAYENVKTVCQMCPFPTIVGHLIVPVIGLLCFKDGNFEDTHKIVNNLKINPDEVQSIFSIPLSYFSSNLNSHTFNLMHEPFNVNFYKSICPIESLNNKIPSDFYRLFINLNETVFNSIDGTFPYLYGFNAFMLILVMFLVEDRDGKQLELCNESLKLNHSNIVQFVDQIRICSYLLYIKEKFSRSKL